MATYLPAQLDREQIQALVDATVDQNPTAPVNKIMGLVMKQAAGKADGTLVREIVENTVA